MKIFNTPQPRQPFPFFFVNHHNDMIPGTGSYQQNPVSQPTGSGKYGLTELVLVSVREYSTHGGISGNDSP
jgi:hypothetical protein